LRTRLPSLVWLLGSALVLNIAAACPALAASRGNCKVESTTFDGWQGQELSNDWVKLTFVPRLGGRLMQVRFGDHDYLFINPKYKGQYFPPMQPGQESHWINYGGDKIWPLPEGTGDDQHWPGPISDNLDDGDYQFSVVNQSQTCTVRLEGLADRRTGLQYSRDISITSDSPGIHFHAVMKNASERAIRWSVQSVSQYNTADHSDPAKYNRDFWAIAPVNSASAYTGAYWVRAGLSDDPSFEVKDGLFRLHWIYLENEVWLDSTAGWVAVVDNSDQYAMIERFRFDPHAEYPGKASIIFYKNGAALELDTNGMPVLRSSNPAQAPYYMEAELNSPMIALNPGQSYAMDTEWFPIRATEHLTSVTEVGAAENLTATVTAQGVRLHGTLSVFFPGTLVAQILDSQGSKISKIDLLAADPLHIVNLDRIIPVSATADRVSIHFADDRGTDRGALVEAKIARSEKSS